MIAPISDHFEQAKAKLLSKYKKFPLFLALLESYVRQVQELEDATWDTISARYLDSADLVRLKVLGRVVGQPYKGEDLPTYLALVKMRILTNRSQGQSQDIIAIIEIMLVGATLTLEDSPPASFVLRVESDIGAVSPIAVHDQIGEAKAAGVGFQMIYQTFANAFLFSATTSPDVDTTHGWGSVTSAGTGGQMVAVI